jgi:hypothetical protein
MCDSRTCRWRWSPCLILSRSADLVSIFLLFCIFPIFPLLPHLLLSLLPAGRPRFPLPAPPLPPPCLVPPLTSSFSNTTHSSSSSSSSLFDQSNLTHYPGSSFKQKRFVMTQIPGARGRRIPSGCGRSCLGYCGRSLRGGVGSRV